MFAEVATIWMISFEKTNTVQSYWIKRITDNSLEINAYNAML